MEPALESLPRRGLLATGLAPLIPQVFGSVLNILYNTRIVIPLLHTEALKARFDETVLLYNVFIYPIAVAAWLAIIVSLRPHFRRLLAGETLDDEVATCVRRRMIHLPWFGAIISGVAWLFCIPVFLISLYSVGDGLSHALVWHLPLSFVVSAFIAMTQSFFLVEVASHRHLFPVFFREMRPDRLQGIHAVTLRMRGWMWAISAGICPIGSLLLLDFAPPTPAGHPVWFAALVGSFGIVLGLYSAVLISGLVAEPVDRLRVAAQAVAAGDYSVRIPLNRADEFGSLIGEFNRMTAGLAERERLRQTFGLHVGRKAADRILQLDPGLSGAEQNITAMFVDIRGFTARSDDIHPREVVALLNEFLGIAVHVIEEHTSGMVNKFPGDGFMALFGAATEEEGHADEALHAARSLLKRLGDLNATLAGRGAEPLAIGIGLHTGPAIVGCIGSPERLEFTAIGHTVNLASRIEALTKVVGVPLVFSEATRTALQCETGVRELPEQQVKGVDDPVRIWTVAEL